MDEVGTATVIMVGIALLIAAVTGFVARNWLTAILLGILASQVFFVIEFGPTSVEEMFFPAAYSTVPASIGAFVGVVVGKRRGVS
jgi:hypothetical protein